MCINWIENTLEDEKCVCRMGKRQSKLDIVIQCFSDLFRKEYNDIRKNNIANRGSRRANK